MFLKLTNVSGKPLKISATVRHAKGSRIEAETREIELAEGEEIEVERTANGFEISAEDIPVAEPAEEETQQEETQQEETQQEDPPGG